MDNVILQQAVNDGHDICEFYMDKYPTSNAKIKDYRFISHQEADDYTDKCDSFKKMGGHYQSHDNRCHMLIKAPNAFNYVITFYNEHI